MMRMLIVAVSLAAACSARQSTPTAERSVPQCLSLCSNQFTACTEEFPGDASACLPARRDCERTCEGEKAMKRAEDGTRDGIQAPVDPPQFQPAPDAGNSGTDTVD